MGKTELSIVIPMFNEAENVNAVYERVTKALKKLGKGYEIIFVDDGSRDFTLARIREICAKDKSVKGVSLMRNFGKAAALSAGFENSSGDIIITMDGDLQDEPEEIGKFISKINEGYDLVTGWKTDKHRGSLRRISSLLFNRLTSRMTRLNIHDFNCPFKAYRKDIVKDLSLYGEMHRFIPALAYWKGCRIAEIKVLNHQRHAGKTKYSSKRLLKGFFDLVTVKYLSSYRHKPLHFFGAIGLVFTLMGLGSGAYLFWLWLFGGGIGTRPLLMLSALMTMVGIQFISIGLLGEMIANSNERQQKSYKIREIIQ